MVFRNFFEIYLVFSHFLFVFLLFSLFLLCRFTVFVQLSISPLSAVFLLFLQYLFLLQLCCFTTKSAEQARPAPRYYFQNSILSLSKTRAESSLISIGSTKVIYILPYTVSSPSFSLSSRLVQQHSAEKPFRRFSFLPIHVPCSEPPPCYVDYKITAQEYPLSSPLLSQRQSRGLPRKGASRHRSLKIRREE